MQDRISEAEAIATLLDRVRAAVRKADSNVPLEEESDYSRRLCLLSDLLDDAGKQADWLTYEASV